MDEANSSVHGGQIEVSTFDHPRRKFGVIRGQLQFGSGSQDAGKALQELLGFADMVAAAQPPRPFEPLVFPALARLAEHGTSAEIAQRT